MGKRILIVVAALAVVLALPAAASAHAVLLRSSPSDRAVLATAPAAVHFFFDDTVQPAPGIEAVRNGGGSVQAGPARATGRELIVPLRKGLGDGVYSVRWIVTSSDGHEAAGVMAFGVGSSSAPVPGLSAASTGPGASGIVARWLFFLGLLSAAGIAVFHLVVWRPTVPETELRDADRQSVREEERWEGSLLLAVCLTTALGGALLLLLLTQAPGETRFGRVVIAGACLAGVGLISALVSLVTRWARPFALAAALAMFPLPTLAGHALDPGRSRLDLVVDVAHVTAAGVWLGGLLSLLVVAPRSDAVLPERRRDAVLRPLAYRFSTLALAAVALLIASGIWRAVVELSSFSQLWTTGYGRAILVKSALLLFTLGLAVRNRYFSLGGPYRRLRLGVLGESAVLLGVLLAVAFLTDLPPGRVAAASSAPQASAPSSPKLPPPGALVLAREDGKLAVALAATPLPGRRLDMTATVVSPNNTGVDGLPVVFGVGGRASNAVSCGSGCYRAVTPRDRIVAVSIAGKLVRFRLPARWAPAGGLIRRATAAFEALRSVSYVERLSSGPGVQVTSDFRLEAPNRLQYQIRGGADGIVIGGRRWDRTPGTGWKKSETQPLDIPTPVWSQGPTNANVVRTSKRYVYVSLVDRSIPAWFLIRFDRKTLRPRSLEMTAAAHFMHHRYTEFNRGGRIRPPR